MRNIHIARLDARPSGGYVRRAHSSNEPSCSLTLTSHVHLWTAGQTSLAPVVTMCFAPLFMRIIHENLIAISGYVSLCMEITYSRIVSCCPCSCSWQTCSSPPPTHLAQLPQLPQPPSPPRHSTAPEVAAVSQQAEQH